MPREKQLADSELNSSEESNPVDSIPTQGIPYRTIPYDEAIEHCRSAPTVPRRLPIFLELSEQRDIDFNLKKLTIGWSISWNRTENVEAVLMQVTGSLADTPCERCLRGLGPFQGCVVSDVCGLGSCANCYYSSKRYRCNLRKKTPEAEDAAKLVAPAAAMAHAAPAQRLAVPAASILLTAPPQPLAVPAQLDAPFLLPRLVPEGMPYLDKRALARRLREVADLYDQSAADDHLAHLGA